MNSFIQYAAQSTQKASFGWENILPIVAVIAVFFFLVYLPQQKRQKQHQAMMASLKVGDAVVLSSGVGGYIKDIKDAWVYIMMTDDTSCWVQKSYVSSVVEASSMPWSLSS